MLRQRVLTALILAPLAVWGILALPNGAFALLSGVIFLLGAREWAAFTGLEGRVGRWAYAALPIVLAGPVLMWPSLQAVTGQGWIVLGLLWWLGALGAVLRYPRGSGLWQHAPVATAAAGVVVLAPAWLALVQLQADDPRLVLLLVLLVWGADIGAFFAGRRWGRHKLAPRVSPGKTWEGFWGALVAVVVVASVARWVAPELVAMAWPPYLVGVAVVMAASVLGDLVESMFKRLTGIKDSGHLLPGHGGVLDRIDSLTAAAPVFLFVIWLGGAGL